MATATASHSRVARAGCAVRVRCHCQPPRLVSLQLCSIQARKPYQAAVLTAGGQSVTSNHRSAWPGSQQTSKVPASGLILNAVPAPVRSSSAAAGATRWAPLVNRHTRNRSLAIMALSFFGGTVLGPLIFALGLMLVQGTFAPGTALAFALGNPLLLLFTALAAGIAWWRLR